MPPDRSSCPSVTGLTRALGFAWPGDFARASSRSASSMVPPEAGRSARAQAVVGRRSRRTSGGGGEVSGPPCPLRLTSIVRHTTSFLILAVLCFSGCASFTQAPEEKLNVEKLTPEQIAKVQTLVAKLEPFIEKKDRKGELPSLTFNELESLLNSREKRFLRLFRGLNAAETGVTIPFHGFSQGEKDLVRVIGQKILGKGKGEEKIIPPQFLSPQVYLKYRFMMSAMESDTGKRLFVESGYRSSAHQLYLFIYFLSNHDYSIRETAKWVALPGYSEHGNPRNLAIDFINEEGINGEKNASEFEVLPEFNWLLKNAGRFGFVLSYPKNAGAGITYEPWHWRYDGIPPASAIRSSVHAKT